MAVSYGALPTQDPDDVWEPVAADDARSRHRILTPLGTLAAAVALVVVAVAGTAAIARDDSTSYSSSSPALATANVSSDQGVPRSCIAHIRTEVVLQGVYLVNMTDLQEEMLKVTIKVALGEVLDGLDGFDYVTGVEPYQDGAWCRCIVSMQVNFIVTPRRDSTDESTGVQVSERVMIYLAEALVRGDVATAWTSTVVDMGLAFFLFGDADREVLLSYFDTPQSILTVDLGTRLLWMESCVQPTTTPTYSPSTASPSLLPTGTPTPEPSASESPSSAPTRLPSTAPTSKPTAFRPTPGPTSGPTTTLSPLAMPTMRPTPFPVRAPTAAPAPLPTRAPFPHPSSPPSEVPRPMPSRLPTTLAPSIHPTTPSPTPPPTSVPSRSPSGGPTLSRPTPRPSDFHFSCVPSPCPGEEGHNTTPKLDRSTDYVES